MGWDMGLLLVGAIPIIYEVGISSCWDSHTGLSSLEVACASTSSQLANPRPGFCRTRNVVVQTRH